MDYIDLKYMHSQMLLHLDTCAKQILTDLYGMGDSTTNYSSLHQHLWKTILATMQAIPITKLDLHTSSLSYLARCLELLSRNISPVHKAEDSVECLSDTADKRVFGCIPQQDPAIKYKPPERSTHVATLYSLHRDATARISDLASKLPTLDIAKDRVVEGHLNNLLKFDVTLSGKHNSYTDDLDIYMVLISKAIPVTSTSATFKLDKTNLNHYKAFWQLATIPDNLCDLAYGINRSQPQRALDVTASVKDKVRSILKKSRDRAFKTGPELLKLVKNPVIDFVDLTTDLTSRKSNKGTKFKKIGGFCSPLPNV